MSKELTPSEVSRLIRPFWQKGRIVRWPAREGKRRLVLAEVARLLPPGRRMPEPELNAILREIWPDHAQLRRALVDYELVNRRYRRGSLVLTTNREPKDLYALFPNPVLAEGLLDRLLNSAHVVTMLGRSYRPRQRPGGPSDTEPVGQRVAN